MTRTLLAGLALLALAPLSAQHALVRDHDFSAVLPTAAMAGAFKEPTVLLQRTVITDIEEEGDEAFEYYLMHHTVLLRDEGSIEAENKVHVGLNSVVDVVKVKARSIAPDGRVQELEKDAFKRATDEDGTGSYLYFAFEGLVPGSIIDFFYVLKKRPNLRGDGEQLQVGVPIVNEELHLINPARLVYASKNYPGVPPAVNDTSDTSVQHQRWELHNVPAIEKEESANMAAASLRVAYKLDRIPDRSIKGFSSYLNATKLYHGMVHQTIESKQQKEIAAMVKKLGLAKLPNDEEKIRALEDHLKTNYQVIEVSAPELTKIETILKNKAANEMGMVALTCACLRELGIDYQLVVTSDRTVLPFDPEFESFQFLHDVGIFLPSVNKYMAPSQQGLRLGYLPAENMNNHGLFIRNFDVGGALTGVGSVKFIEPLPDVATIHDHIITADLSADPGNCDLTFENQLTGYYAPLQCFYPFLDEDKKTEITNQYVTYLVENGDVKELTVENGEGKYFGVKPLIIKGRVETRKFSGSAGEKVLFKIGELIGPQVEMYSEKPRKLPVDDEYNRRFNRSIDVVLPAGYTVQNLSDLTIDKHLDMDGKRELSFTCTATQEGNVLKVRIEEYYRRCQVPLEQYEGYRTVVNAAADFNKVALVLVKG